MKDKKVRGYNKNEQQNLQRYKKRNWIESGTWVEYERLLESIRSIEEWCGKWCGKCGKDKKQNERGKGRNCIKFSDWQYRRVVSADRLRYVYINGGVSLWYVAITYRLKKPPTVTFMQQYNKYSGRYKNSYNQLEIGRYQLCKLK